MLPPAEQGASAAAGQEGAGQEGFQKPKKPRRHSPGTSRSPSHSPPPGHNRFAMLIDAADAAPAAADGEAAAAVATDA